MLFNELKSFIFLLKRALFSRPHQFDTPGFEEIYRSENQKLMVGRVRLLLSVGAILYLNLTVIDFVVYPEHARFFLCLRLTVAIVGFLGVWSTFQNWGQRHLKKLFFLTVLFADGCGYIMLSQIGGWSCNAFVTNLLIALAITMFIPWNPLIMLFYCSCSLVLYVVIQTIVVSFSKEATIPIMVMSTNALLCYICSIGSQSNRLSQLEARLEIEKAHAQLKALDNAKTAFFDNTNHELRTPVTMIISPLEAILQSRLEPSAEILSSMLVNARRLLRQVNMLLDLGKADSGGAECRREAGDLSELLASVVSATMPAAHRRGVKIDMSQVQKVPASLFDLEKIETVAVNLISNALKFTPQSGQIWLSCELNAEKTQLCFAVDDNGPGIPAESLAKIFERFHQVDSSATRRVQGTGLGLSVTKEFVELHGGHILASKSPHGGARFYVEIPFQPATSESGRGDQDQLREISADLDLQGDSESQESFERENEIQVSSSKRPMVLYADDNFHLREFVKSLLVDNYRVLLACDGEQAFELALRYKPDLILSDVMMPKLTGVDLCKKIRLEPELKDLPIVLLTAKSSTGAKVAGLGEGADDYLGKPFSVEELLARVKNLITLQQQRKVITLQLKAARAIQRSLLPPLNQTVGPFAIEAIYQPHDELSGDFFDTIQSENWLYLYLADVTGHGIPAAQATYLIKEIVSQGLNSCPGMDLAELFSWIRDSYVKHRLEYDVSLQLCRLNCDNFVLELMRSNAPAAVMVVKDEVQYLEIPPSTAISAVLAKEKSRPQVEIRQLSPTDSLYLFSDGATEFETSPGRQFGEKRLSKLFLDSHADKVWSQQLLSQLKAQTPQQVFSDDVTIIRIIVNSTAKSFKAS